MTIEDRRLKLHNMFVSVLGSKEVYYDPPESIRMTYPAIVYNINNIDMSSADNIGYLRKVAYTWTLIRKDDGDDILDRLLDLPYTKFNRPYISENLHHDVGRTFI